MQIQELTTEERILSEVIAAMGRGLDGMALGGEFVSARSEDKAVIVSLLHENPFIRKGIQIALIIREDLGGAIEQRVSLNPDPTIPRIAIAAREEVSSFLQAHRFILSYPRDCFWPVWSRRVPLLV